VGPSMIKAFGNFQGGQLNYWPDDNRTLKLEALPEEGKIKQDISKGLMMFDGNRAHEVDDFTGERYSLVYFTAPRFWKLPAEGQKLLKERGFPYPVKHKVNEIQKILSPPQGYKGKSSKLKAKSLAGFRFWPHSCPKKLKLEVHAKRHWATRKPRRVTEEKQTLKQLTPFDTTPNRRASGLLWAHTQQLTIGPNLTRGKQLLFKGQKTVADAVEALNGNDVSVPQVIKKAGCCAVYSQRTQVYYVVWKHGYRRKALSSFGIKDNSNQIKRVDMVRSKNTHAEGAVRAKRARVG